MSGGGKGGSSTAFDRAQIPPGFRSNLKRFGKQTGSALTGPEMQDITGQTLDYYRNLQSSPYITETANALLRQVQDPTSLTDPLFMRERERLGGELVERGRQIGGLDSSATATLLGTGLGEFTDRYLSEAYGRQLGAGSQLFQQRLGLGQALFTPFQAYSQPYMALLGRGQQQPAFNNSKGQAGQTAGSIIGSIPWGEIIGAASSASDARLKDDVITLAHVGPLTLVSWTWNSLAAALDIGLVAGQRTIGFIADEVARVFPEAVTRAADGYLRLNYPLVYRRLARG